MKNKHKKGEIEIAFNWFYVLMAGAVILMFFIWIVLQQKAESESNLSVEVVQIMESIFTGATVSEKTKQMIDTSGLVDYTLYFDCQDNLTEYGIKGTSARAQVPLETVFSPYEIKTSQIIAWSIPYKLPYKVMDLLMITSSNSKYVLLGSGESNSFALEFWNNTEEFNRQWVKSREEYLSFAPGNNFQFRFIDFEGGNFINQGIPPQLKNWDDNKVSALVFTGTNQVDYYYKKGLLWEKVNSNPLFIVSFVEERDAAKYAAVFSANDQIYQCNMKKVWKRLKYLNTVYESKLNSLIEYYQGNPVLSTSTGCLASLTQAPKGNIKSLLETHRIKTEMCLSRESYCPDLISTAKALKDANEALGTSCLSLY